MGTAAVGMLRLPNPAVLPGPVRRFKLGPPEQFSAGSETPFPEQNLVLFPRRRRLLRDFEHMHALGLHRGDDPRMGSPAPATAPALTARAAWWVDRRRDRCPGSKSVAQPTATSSSTPTTKSRRARATAYRSTPWQRPQPQEFLHNLHDLPGRKGLMFPTRQSPDANTKNHRPRSKPVSTHPQRPRVRAHAEAHARLRTRLDGNGQLADHPHHWRLAMVSTSLRPTLPINRSRGARSQLLARPLHPRSSSLVGRQADRAGRSAPHGARVFHRQLRRATRFRSGWSATHVVRP